MICDNYKYIKQLENDLEFLINYRAKLDQQKSNDQDIKHTNMQIKKLKRRIKEIKATDGMEFNEVDFRDGKVIYNEDLDRIQIKFDKTPDKDIIEILQGSGFKCSSYNQVWQRFFNRPSVTATKWILYKIKELERKEVIQMEMELTKYIQNFDRVFHTNLIDTVKGKNFPMIELAFQTIGEYIYARNKDINYKSDKMNALLEELKTINDKKVLEIFDKYDEIACEIDYETKKQLLTFGFCICLEQLKEMDAIEFKKRTNI